MINPSPVSIDRFPQPSSFGRIKTLPYKRRLFLLPSGFFIDKGEKVSYYIL